MLTVYNNFSIRERYIFTETTCRELYSSRKCLMHYLAKSSQYPLDIIISILWIFFENAQILSDFFKAKKLIIYTAKTQNQISFCFFVFFFGIILIPNLIFFHWYKLYLICLEFFFLFHFIAVDYMNSVHYLKILCACKWN